MIFTKPQPLTDTALHRAMNAVRDGGISIIPIDASTKRPWADLLPRDRETGKATWKPFQEAIVDPHTLCGWQRRGLKAFAVVCGEVSGGLLILDFDEPRFFEAWHENVGDLAQNLPLQQTGGGGYQVALRCDNPGGNQKLAWVPDASQAAGRSAAIETRGEGGYAVLAPSLHPSANLYEVLAGDFANIPKVSQACADALMLAARKLDECAFTKQQLDRAKAAKPKSAPWKVNGQASVIDQFNARYGVEEILAERGYRKARDRMIRPGADETSEAGVQIFDGDRGRVSFHWSTNDPLNDGHAHDAFSVFCELDHGGDFRIAVKSAAEKLGLSKPTFSSIRAALHAPVAEPEVIESTETPSIELGAYLGQIVSGEVRAVPWAHPWLTKLTNALLPGTTTCVVGDPGVGKTFFILQNYLHWFANGYNPCVYFLEKNRRFYTMRLLALLEERGDFVNFEWIKNNPGEVRDAMERNGDTIDELAKNFHETGGRRVTLEQIAKWASDRARNGHRVIVVDPITAAYAGDKRWEKDEDFVLNCESEMSKHGASLIVINHSKKGNRQGAATMHDMGLGFAFAKYSDTLIWIAKSKKPRKVMFNTPAGPAHGKFDLFFQIQKARNGKGSNTELAFTFGDGLRFAEQGMVSKDLPETDEVPI